MATFEELMRAASNADRAGDEGAARRLVQAAQAMRQKQAGPLQTSAGPIPRADAVREQPLPEPVDRFGDTFSAAVEGPLAATKFFAAQSQDRSRSRAQRAGDYAMTGLNALGTGVAAAAGLAGEAFGGSPTNERKLARDLMMAGAVAVPELAGVSSVAARAGQSAAAASRGVPAPKTTIEAGKRAADDLGITPSLGAGGKVRSMTAATLEKVPVAGGVIGKDAARFVDEIEAAAIRAKSSIGQPSTPSDAGAALQTGLNKYIERSKAKAEQLYSEVGKKIPADTVVPLDNTARAIEDAKAAFANLPELSRTLGLNRWDGIIEEAQTNGINWQAVRQFRTSIGEAIGNQGGTLQDEAKSRLSALYAALSDDMGAAANAAGPEAAAAWERANRFYRQFGQRVETALDKTIKADSPERAFEAFDRMLRADSSSADVNRVLKIKASLKPGEWNDLAASIVDRLGKPNAAQRDADGGGFSPQRFLTQWNSMSPEAKRVLLPESARVELQKLADVAALSRSANAERNFSNTGNILTGSAFGAGAVQNLPLTLFAAGATWGSAKALTSPVFLRAVNRAGRGDIKPIQAMANGRGPFVDDARTVLQIMGAETAAAGGANQNTRPLLQAQ